MSPSSMLKPALLALFAVLITAMPAAAEPLGKNGQIAYSRFNPGVGFWEFDVLTANPDGSHERLFRSDTQGLQWSPDGARAFIYTDAADGRLTAALINADGTNYRELALPDATLNLGAGTWTPDGTRLVVDGWDDQAPTRNGMYRIRADFRKITQVTVNPYGGHDAPADMSPDGSRVLFTREDPSGHALFVAGADGSHARQITPTALEASYMAGWSPRGGRIVFDAQGSIFLVRPNGRHLRQIPIVLHGQQPFAFNAGWSPDGRRIGVTLCTESCDVYTVRPDGRDLVRVTDTPEFEEFSDWGTHPLVR